MSVAEEGAPAGEIGAPTQRAWVRPTLGRRIKWRLEQGIYVAFEAVLGILPLTWLAGLGRTLGGAAYRIFPRRRRTVERNLRIAFAGERAPDELKAMAREVFRRSGANLLCSLGTADRDPATMTDTLTVHGVERLHAALAPGKGVVLVIAHMGNWEAMAQWLPLVIPPEVKVANIYRPLNNPWLDARVLATRSRQGLHLFSKDESPLAMAAFVRAGGVLSIMSDQRAGVAGELVPFFGRTTSATPLPAILARRTGAALIGVSLRTRSTGRWALEFHAPEEAHLATAGVMRFLETIMRVSAEDVFWFQDRWRPGRKAPQRLEGRVARGEVPDPSKLRRVLLWADEAGQWPSAPEAVPADVRYERTGRAEDGDWQRAPGEAVRAFLDRVDAGAALPLDYVVGGGSEVRAACRALGLGWVEGGA